jgi:hypothetical protein
VKNPQYKNNICNCPFFTSAGLGAEVSMRSTRNTAPPQTPTTSNTVPYSPEHLIRNTTEVYIRNTTENYSQNSSKRLHLNLHVTGIADTSWAPSTTQPLSSTTEEVKGEGVWSWL